MDFVLSEEKDPTKLTFVDVARKVFQKLFRWNISVLYCSSIQSECLPSQTDYILRYFMAWSFSVHLQHFIQYLFPFFILVSQGSILCEILCSTMPFISRLVSCVGRTRNLTHFFFISSPPTDEIKEQCNGELCESDTIRKSP